MGILTEKQELNGMRIAMLATDGFEEAELFEPKAALEKAGAQVDIISLKAGKIKGWKTDNWSKTADVDVPVSQALASHYAALMLPGGVINADKLRMNNGAVEFVKDFVHSDKPIAAICHGAWILIEAGAVREKHLTSWPSLQTDLENAGAHWRDEEVIVDSLLVTSRKPADLPAFNKKMVDVFSGIHSVRGEAASIEHRAGKH